MFWGLFSSSVMAAFASMIKANKLNSNNISFFWYFYLNIAKANFLFSIFIDWLHLEEHLYHIPKGGGHGDLWCCGIDVFFFNAVMRWVKSQLAVLRWSQTLRCAMFVFFTLRCSVKWNWSQCWGFWFTFFKPKFDLNLACKLNDLSITSTVPPLITPFETEHLTVCCQSWSFYVS